LKIVPPSISLPLFWRSSPKGVSAQAGPPFHRRYPCSRRRVFLIFFPDERPFFRSSFDPSSYRLSGIIFPFSFPPFLLFYVFFFWACRERLDPALRALRRALPSCSRGFFVHIRFADDLLLSSLEKNLAPPLSSFSPTTSEGPAAGLHGGVPRLFHLPFRRFGTCPAF